MSKKTVKRICQHCKNEFERPRDYVRRTALAFCSQECYVEHTVNMTPGQIADRASRIVAMIQRGWTQVAIAKEIGITRQRVKAIYDATTGTKKFRAGEVCSA